ncbi:MAG: hypothetical protein HKN54_08880 [Flavobacteriaceae bacterium]|nr:hypothetical protein [Flavobacteriaceae bacterium]
MKKSTIMLSALFLFILMGCSTENDTITNSIDPNFRVFEYAPKGGNTFIGDKAVEDECIAEGDACLTTALIAGQNYTAGTISVTTDGVDLIITYCTANNGWTLDATHLSIGDCGEQEIPTTGSGNPKVGHFEHSDEHDAGTTTVVYKISLDAVELSGEIYCFAAHAEVTGPNGQGETAWGEGLDFDGNSWAMYVQSSLNDCAFGGEEEEEGPGGTDEE